MSLPLLLSLVAFPLAGLGAITEGASPTVLSDGVCTGNSCSVGNVTIAAGLDRLLALQTVIRSTTAADTANTTCTVGGTAATFVVRSVPSSIATQTLEFEILDSALQSIGTGSKAVVCSNPSIRAALVVVRQFAGAAQQTAEDTSTNRASAVTTTALNVTPSPGAVVCWNLGFKADPGAVNPTPDTDTDNIDSTWQNTRCDIGGSGDLDPSWANSVDVEATGLSYAPAQPPVPPGFLVSEGFWPFPYEVVDQALPDGEQNQPYPGAAFVAINGEPAYTWSMFAGSLPSGMSLSPAGVLSGTPTNTGTFNFTVRASDAGGGEAYRAFSLDVGGAPPDPPDAPWVQSFSPARTHYVDDVSCGGAGTIGDPECPGGAFTSSHYQCGDLHIIRAGTYLSGQAEFGGFSRNCAQSNPAVWKGFVSPTGQPENARFVAEIQTPGAWNWFVGLHSDLSGNSNRVHAYSIRDGGVRVINTVAHDSIESVIAWWMTGPGGSGMVIYGSVLYGAGRTTPDSPPHNIYTQNDFNLYGWKYFVQNVSLDPGPEGRRLFQAFNSNSTDRAVSGYHLEKNLFGDADEGNGNTVLWDDAFGETTDKIVWKRNYFVDFKHSSTLQKSARMGKDASLAISAQVTDNYFARANFMAEGYWGVDGGTHDQYIFSGNEIYNPPNGIHVEVTTQAGSINAGAYEIPDQDLWNNNTYGGTFQGLLHCEGTNHGTLNLTNWRTNTDGCRDTPGGTSFDASSTEVSNPTVNKIEVTVNEYQCPIGCPWTDMARGNIYIVNWEGVSSDGVDISAVVSPNKQYIVRYARDFFGTAAASGTCPGSGACIVTLPTKRTDSAPAGEFTNAYVITAAP